MSTPGFCDSQERAQQVVPRVKELRGWVDPFGRLEARAREARELNEMFGAEGDDATLVDLDREVEALEGDLEAFELRRPAFVGAGERSELTHARDELDDGTLEGEDVSHEFGGRISLNLRALSRDRP